MGRPSDELWHSIEDYVATCPERALGRGRGRRQLALDLCAVLGGLRDTLMVDYAPLLTAAAAAAFLAGMRRACGGSTVCLDVFTVQDVVLIAHSKRLIQRLGGDGDGEDGGKGGGDDVGGGSACSSGGGGKEGDCDGGGGGRGGAESGVENTPRFVDVGVGGGTDSSAAFLPEGSLGGGGGGGAGGAGGAVCNRAKTMREHMANAATDLRRQGPGAAAAGAEMAAEATAAPVIYDVAAALGPAGLACVPLPTITGWLLGRVVQVGDCLKAMLKVPGFGD